MWLLGRKENVKEMAQCWSFTMFGEVFCFDAKLLFKILRKNPCKHRPISTSSIKSKSTYFCSILRYYFWFFLYRLFHLSLLKKFLIFPTPIPTPWYLYLNLGESLWSYLRQHNYRVEQSVMCFTTCTDL